jgi:hypothetical protein
MRVWGSPASSYANKAIVPEKADLRFVPVLDLCRRGKDSGPMSETMILDSLDLFSRALGEPWATRRMDQDSPM